THRSPRGGDAGVVDIHVDVERIFDPLGDEPLWFFPHRALGVGTFWGPTRPSHIAARRSRPAGGPARGGAVRMFSTPPHSRNVGRSTTGMTWAPLLPAPLGAEAESAGISAWFTTRAAGNLDPHLASPTQASSRKVKANRQALDDVVG